MKTPQLILKFRFTPTLFAVDDSKYTGKFLDSPVQSLYDIGFENEPSYFDEAGKFLYKIADTFLTLLSKTEGIELLRDKVLVALDDDTVKDLQNSLPFAPGSEYVNLDWIKNLWQKLNECYSKEIENYSGTVAIYLAEKSQHLKVAEKIFFHLVENHNDDNFPFSFLATYSTKTDDGSIKHVPLKYALTEYKNNRDKILELLSCLNKAGDVCPLINEFIEKGDFSSVKEAMEKSMAEGSQTFEQDIARLIIEGVVDKKEGIAYADSPTNLQWRLQNDFANKTKVAEPEDDVDDEPSFTEITLDVKH